MRRRGHVLLLVVMALAVALVGVTVFASRFLVSVDGRRAATLRTQTLWLARSGCLSGAKGTQTVKTSLGQAQLVGEKDGFRATLNGAQATVTCSTLDERYTPAPGL
jgi:hypothetical protein